MSSSIRCPRCGSEHVNVQVINEVYQQGAGCLTWLLWIILALTIVGLLIVVPLFLGRSKNIKRTIAVCQNCGSRWEL